MSRDLRIALSILAAVAAGVVGLDPLGIPDVVQGIAAAVLAGLAAVGIVPPSLTESPHLVTPGIYLTRQAHDAIGPIVPAPSVPPAVARLYSDTDPLQTVPFPPTGGGAVASQYERYQDERDEFLHGNAGAVMPEYLRNYGAWLRNQEDTRYGAH